LTQANVHTNSRFSTPFCFHLRDRRRGRTGETGNAAQDGRTTRRPVRRPQCKESRPHTSNHIRLRPPSQANCDTEAGWARCAGHCCAAVQHVTRQSAGKYFSAGRLSAQLFPPQPAGHSQLLLQQSTSSPVAMWGGPPIDVCCLCASYLQPGRTTRSSHPKQRQQQQQQQQQVAFCTHWQRLVRAVSILGCCCCNAAPCRPHRPIFTWRPHAEQR